MDKRPNILFLMSDQHRYDTAGFAGDTVVRTPRLDALARDAAVFTNAYTPSPVCIPARQCMMAGKYPAACGCLRYGDDLPPGTETFARAFSRHAYHTVVAGKLHHFGLDQMQGWTRRIAGDCEVSPRFIEGAVAGDFQRCARNAPQDVYTASGRGKNRWEVERAGIGLSQHQEFDELAVTGAVSFIRNHFANVYYDRTGAHFPLLLKVSLIRPHYPFLTDETRFRHYLNRVPVYDEQPCAHPVLGTSQAQPRVDVAFRDKQRATAAYYGMVDKLDEDFGRVLDALAETGQDIDDWIVVYTSDHGEMLGQHGLWEKQRFYEASARVPLFIRLPKSMGGRHRTIDRNVNLTDLFATLCDLCHIPVPPGLDSRSLAPLIHDPSAAWDDQTTSRYEDMVMLKRGPLKYQYYPAHRSEVLFDLERDPSENTDFAADPGYAAEIAAFRRRLETTQGIRVG